MRNMLLTIVIGILCINCALRKKVAPEPKYQMGWYFEVEKNEASGLVKDSFLDKYYHIETAPILTITDFKSMKIEKPNWGGQERVIIGVTLNEDVKEKWGELTKRMSKTNEKALFVYKNEVIANVSAFQRIDNGYVMIANDDLTEKMLNKIITTINQNR